LNDVKSKNLDFSKNALLYLYSHLPGVELFLQIRYYIELPAVAKKIGAVNE
jgi:hypothetical protein